MKKLWLLLLVAAFTQQTFSTGSHDQPTQNDSANQQVQQNSALPQEQIQGTKKNTGYFESIFAGTAAVAAGTWSALTVHSCIKDYQKKPNLEEKNIKQLTLTMVFVYIAFEAAKKSIAAFI